MGEEGIEIGRLDHVRRAAQRLVDVAGGLEALGRAVLGEGHRLLGEALAALGRGRALVPGDLKRLARPIHPPPIVAHNRDAAEQPGQVVAAVDHEGLLHSGLFLDLVEVGARDLAAEHRAFDVDRVQHARNRDVDAEQRLAAHDPGAVDPAHGLADNDVVLGVFQRDLVRVGNRQQRRLRHKVAIAQLPSARGVDHHALARGALGDRDAPTLCRRRNQHSPRGGAGPAQRIPVHRRRQAAPGELRAVFQRVQRCVLDPHAGPIAIELLGDQHRQHGLHALADFRILGKDGHHPVRRDADEIAEPRAGAQS